MKYSKRVESLFLQKYYTYNPAVTYRKEWWLVRNVISSKKARLFKVPHSTIDRPAKAIVVDASECIIHSGDWPLDVVFHAWLRNVVNLRYLISNWNTANKRGGLKHSDMFQYTSKDEVWEDVKRVLERETRREHKKLLKASGAKLVHKSKNHFIYKLLTYEGAVVLGKSTRWCISSTYKPDVGRSTFNDYQERSDMFVIIDRRTNEKWCTLYSKHKGYMIKLCNNEGGRFDFKKKITGFNQKDDEIEEKQLFLAIKGITEEGREEEFLREVFERHASPRESDFVHSEQISAGSMRYDYQEVDRYGMRDAGSVIGDL